MTPAAAPKSGTSAGCLAPLRFQMLDRSGKNSLFPTGPSLARELPTLPIVERRSLCSVWDWPVWPVCARGSDEVDYVLVAWFPQRGAEQSSAPFLFEFCCPVPALSTFHFTN